MVMLSQLKRLVGPSVKGLRARFLQWTKPLTRFLAAWNTSRAWQKESGPCGRKGALTRASHHPEAAGETTSMHEKGSPAPRPLGKGGSGLQANTHHSSRKRRGSRLPSGALSSVLEAHIKDANSPAQGRRRNDGLDQADGEG